MKSKRLIDSIINNSSVEGKSCWDVLPTLDLILYVHPNPDGSRKKCSNCIMWVIREQCVVHSPNLEITARHICGYHVYGKPMSKWMDHPGIDPVDPRYSGLQLVPDGTSCDNCKRFKQNYQGSICTAAKDKYEAYKHPNVHPMGCCARWDEMSSLAGAI